MTRIEKGKQRLQLINAKNENSKGSSRRKETINLLSEKIKKLIREVEEAGTRGDVDQAQTLMKSCELLKKEKDTLIEKDEKSLIQEPNLIQEKQMEVCEVCGAFLIIGDVQQRIDDHLCGKQHLGYLQVRKAVQLNSEQKLREREDTKRKREEQNRCTPERTRKRFLRER